MTTDLRAWCAAVSLIREFREPADFEAGRLVAAAEDGGDKDHARRVAAAVVALLRAAENHERQPALYMRFEWPSLITPEEQDEAWYRHEGRTDFGFESIRDLLTRGPLVVLRSKSIDGAQAEAAEYWEDRSALEPAEKPAEGYCVFDQTGLILFGWLRVFQQKTKKWVWIYCHADLVPALEAHIAKHRQAAPGKADAALIQNTKGAKFNRRVFVAWWDEVAVKAGIVTLSGEKGVRRARSNPTRHDLRRNATTRLAEAGCSVDEISSITGLSPSMIQKQVYNVRTKVHSKAGIKKLERNR